MADCHVIVRTRACPAKADASNAQQRTHLFCSFMQAITLNLKPDTKTILRPISIHGKITHCVVLLRFSDVLSFDKQEVAFWRLKSNGKQRPDSTNHQGIIDAFSHREMEKSSSQSNLRVALF